MKKTIVSIAFALALVGLAGAGTGYAATNGAMKKAEAKKPTFSTVVPANQHGSLFKTSHYAPYERIQIPQLP
jgi:hypothetical protein